MRYPNPRRRPTPPPVWLYLVTAAAIIWWLSEPGTPAIFRVWMWMARAALKSCRRLRPQKRHRLPSQCLASSQRSKSRLLQSFYAADLDLLKVGVPLPRSIHCSVDAFCMAGFPSSH